MADFRRPADDLAGQLGLNIQICLHSPFLAIRERELSGQSKSNAITQPRAVAFYQ